MTSPFDSQASPVARVKPGRKTSMTPSRRIRQRRSAKDSDRPLLAEWHAMTPAERKAAWRQLIDWVAWLHDRYEMSVAHRLPDCWPQHPGLVEELWALKKWRDDIYNTDGSGNASATGQGQAARYWHAELRNVITAAEQTYAAKCRSGHKQAASLTARNAELHEKWAQSDPLVGVDPVLALPAATDTMVNADTVDDASIADALARGTAAPLGKLVTDYVQHAGFWWTRSDNGWMKITDTDFTATLDAAAEQVRHADTAVDYTSRLLSGGSATGHPETD